MRVLLTVAYDGTLLAGWQRQPGEATAQEHLERSIARVCGVALPVKGAGRTDAGVHALRQCAHVDLPRAWPMPALQRALNAYLPPAIVVLAARPVPSTFHARFSAVGKRYVYRFLTGHPRPVHLRGFFLWSSSALDVPAMRAAAACLRGEHDFASFASNPGYVRKRGTVRRIDHVHIRPHRRGVDVAVQGNGFLYNMVRTIAGCLRDVGLRRRSPDGVAAILAARDRRVAGATLPPHGLYLVRVLYPPDAFDWGLESARTWGHGSADE